MASDRNQTHQNIVSQSLQVRAQAYATGDMHFYKDGRHVQRLFEDEQGLYLENTHTGGGVSRVPRE
jgi:hypothetical protein